MSGDHLAAQEDLPVPPRAHPVRDLQGASTTDVMPHVQVGANLSYKYVKCIY